MDPDTITQAAQFGTAGLIAAMWLLERRSALERERHLREAHDRLMEQRTQLDALMSLVADNTRAATALEAGQRAIAQAIQRLLGSAATREPPPPGA